MHCALLLHLQFPANALVHRPELLAYITSERIKGNAQLDGALEHLGKVRGRVAGCRGPYWVACCCC